MTVEDAIRAKLTAAFAPSLLRIENESHKHAGHAGVREHGPGVTGETHFRVVIVSDRFAGQSLVARHRTVNETLKDELAGPVHALAIKAHTPDEVSKLEPRQP
jgi:BolA protein